MPLLLGLLLNNQNNNNPYRLVPRITEYKIQHGQPVYREQIRLNVESGRYTDSPSTWNS